MVALAKVLSSFAAILIINRLRVPLSVAILAGAVILAVLFGQDPVSILHLMLNGAIAPSTLALIGITLLLLFLTRTLTISGQLERIVGDFATFVRRPAVAMAALPALIGLLPMPGGAVFSAPMVRQASGDTHVPPQTLSAINYWFRHIWEYWWPMYPGVILAMTLTQTDLPTFIAYQFPLCVFLATGGLVFLFRGTHPELHSTGSRPPAGLWLKLIKETSFLWILIGTMAAADIAIRFLPVGWIENSGTIRRYLPIAAGLLASLLWTVRFNRLKAAQLAEVIRQGKQYQMSFLVLAVMILQYILGNVGAVEKIPPGLERLHIPPVLMVAVLPFVSGMVTGLAIGFVGTSFPVVIAIVAALPGGPPLMPYIVLAYAFGHMGQMLSPIHLCHVMSNEYFGTSFRPMYRRLAGPALLAMALEIGYFMLLRGTFS
jgi:integral membrane protein (TIGR00529 family)